MKRKSTNLSQLREEGKPYDQWLYTRKPISKERAIECLHDLIRYIHEST